MIAPRGASGSRLPSAVTDLHEYRLRQLTRGEPWLSPQGVGMNVVETRQAAGEDAVRWHQKSAPPDP